MYFQFYFPLFSENDGLDFLWKRPNHARFLIWEKTIAMIGLNNVYSLSEIAESARLLR